MSPSSAKFSGKHLLTHYRSLPTSLSLELAPRVSFEERVFVCKAVLKMSSSSRLNLEDPPSPIVSNNSTGTFTSPSSTHSTFGVVMLSKPLVQISSGSITSRSPSSADRCSLHRLEVQPADALPSRTPNLTAQPLGRHPAITNITGQFSWTDPKTPSPCSVTTSTTHLVVRQRLLERPPSSMQSTTCSTRWVAPRAALSVQNYANHQNLTPRSSVGRWDIRCYLSIPSCRRRQRFLPRWKVSTRKDRKALHSTWIGLHGQLGTRLCRQCCHWIQRLFCQWQHPRSFQGLPNLRCWKGHYQHPSDYWCWKDLNDKEEASCVYIYVVLDITLTFRALCSQ